MLHTEAQLPGDKPQKADQEGPVQFGLERGSFGRTRNFVEVLPGREVQGDLRWDLEPFEFQKSIIHQALHCLIFSLCLASKCIFQVLDYSVQIREMP